MCWECQSSPFFFVTVSMIAGVNNHVLWKFLPWNGDVSD
jgi:hypothetical protein